MGKKTRRVANQSPVVKKAPFATSPGESESRRHRVNIRDKPGALLVSLAPGAYAWATAPRVVRSAPTGPARLGNGAQTEGAQVLDLRPFIVPEGRTPSPCRPGKTAAGLTCFAPRRRMKGRRALPKQPARVALEPCLVGRR